MKKIKKELEELKEALDFYKNKSYYLDLKVKKLLDYEASVIPDKMITCKARKKTYVKFMDGSITEVKCCKDDKFNKESGLAFCIMKKVLAPKNIKDLLKKCKDIKVGDDIRQKL